MARMRYFGNTHDPRDPDANRHIVHSWNHETPQDAAERHERWLSDKLIGDPQPSSRFTVHEMREMKLVGVYSYDIDDYAKSDDKCIVNYDGPFHAVGTSMKAMVATKQATLLEAKPCADCNGGGVYHGFNRKPEPCTRCDGTGQE